MPWENCSQNIVDWITANLDKVRYNVHAYKFPKKIDWRLDHNNHIFLADTHLRTSRTSGDPITMSVFRGTMSVDNGLHHIVMGGDFIRFDAIKWRGVRPIPHPPIDQDKRNVVHECLDDLGIAFASEIISEYACIAPLFTLYITGGENSFMKRTVYSLPFYDFPTQVLPTISFPYKYLSVCVDVTPGVGIDSSDLDIHFRRGLMDRVEYLRTMEVAPIVLDQYDAVMHHDELHSI
jgi:hypothetical protein